MQSLPTVEGERRHAKDGDPGAGLACVRDSNREQSVGTGRKSSTDISPWSPYKRYGEGKCQKKVVNRGPGRWLSGYVTSLQD